MKPSSPSSSFAIALLLGTLTLVGCGGALNFPDSVASSQAAGPPIQGSVFGGHAPVQGSHVYLLQPSVTAYGGAATSILGVGTGTTGYPGYPLVADVSDPNVPVGSMYVKSDSNGIFNLTGAYNCTVGNPVYIYAYGGNATGGSTTNTAIVELATLGLCPSSGNFSTAGNNNGAISFIYLNEVSTVAAAYTFQPFTLAGNNSAWDIGSSGSTQALLGIQDAAETAAQLYDIEGATLISTSGDGEGHLANYQTQEFTVTRGVITTKPNQGNGVVPQATIDSLANILAACVDSTGSTSAQCTKLFSTATDNGKTVASGDTAPTDIATAAINIARYPAGNHSAGAGSVDATYASDIFGIPTGTVPYVPNLAHAPNDWTLVINYPTTAVGGYTSATNSTLGRAESIGVDGFGQPWITAQSSIVQWSPLGSQLAYTTSPGSYIYGYVSIDGSNNAWTGNANSTTGIQEFNNNEVLISTYGSGYTTAYTVVADSNDNAYFFASDAGTGVDNTYGQSEMWEYNSSGTLQSHSTNCNGHTAAFVYNCIDPTIFSAGAFVAHGAIESAAAGGYLWLTSENSPYQIARVSPTGTAAFVIDAPARQPEFPSIDASGNAWIAVQETPAVIMKITNKNTGAYTTLTSASTGAELTSTFGSAVDGNGNVWFANRDGNYSAQSGTGAAGVNTIVEINGATNTAISPSTNYIPEAQYPAAATSFTTILDDSLNVAIDPSGNVWVTNYLGNSVAEIVGAAAPLVTPLSYAAGHNQLGTKP